MSYHRRKLQELNLLDDFLFGSMLSYPKISEEFARLLLETVFRKKFGKLTIVPQKTLYGADTDLHGSRLDVYIEEGDEQSLPEDVTIYDGEVDHNSDADDVAALPKRVRFYHSITNVKSLDSGAAYQSLKRVVILMITDYDPFGRDRMCYTIKNQCVEEPDIPYNNGALSLFLYTKGTRGIPNESLAKLLHYMQNTTEENAVNDTLQKIQTMVNTVKEDPEVRRQFMKSWEHDERVQREAKKEGKDEAKKEVAEKMHNRGIAVSEIAYFLGTDEVQINKWLSEVTVPEQTNE